MFYFDFSKGTIWEKELGTGKLLKKKFQGAKVEEWGTWEKKEQEPALGFDDLITTVSKQSSVSPWSLLRNFIKPALTLSPLKTEPGIFIRTPVSQLWRVVPRDLISLPLQVEPACNWMAFLWLRRRHWCSKAEGHLRFWALAMCLELSTTAQLTAAGLMGVCMIHHNHWL